MTTLGDAAGVRTFYEEVGVGRPLAILHGGLENGTAWATLAAVLGDRHRVLVPDRRGHGRTPDVDGDFTLELMADETVAMLDQLVAEPADLVGYSDGGAVALLVALDRPDLVRSLVVIGTVFHHDGILPVMTDRLRHPDPGSPGLASIRQEYGALSPDGPDHWPIFHAKVCKMGITSPTMSTADLGRIDRPVLVIVADDDVVDHHHTITLFESLPAAQLAVVPASSHLLPIEQPEVLARLIVGFVDGEAHERMMPMRAAP